MAIPIAPWLGSFFVTETAKNAAQIAAGALGASKGAAPTENDQTDQGGQGQGSSGVLGGLLGLPAFNPETAKRAVIQGSVITALIVMFFIGLAMFIGRSVKIR